MPTKYEVLCTVMAASRPALTDESRGVELAGHEALVCLIIHDNGKQTMIHGSRSTAIDQLRMTVEQRFGDIKHFEPRVVHKSVIQLALMVRNSAERAGEAEGILFVTDAAEEVIIGSLIGASKAPYDYTRAEELEDWSLVMDGKRQQIVVGEVPDEMSEMVLAKFVASEGLAGATRRLLEVHRNRDNPRSNLADMLRGIPFGVAFEIGHPFSGGPGANPPRDSSGLLRRFFGGGS